MKQFIKSILIFTLILISTQCKKDDNNNSFTVITKAASTITTIGAVLNGTITGNNGVTTVVFEWGLTTAYGNTVTADPSPITVSTATDVTYSLDSLTDGTTYHYRVVASNTSGKTYGSDISFTTQTIQYELALIHTDFGNMLIWLYTQTPLHKANFLSLTKSKYYDGLIFHRVVPDFVIQGGDPDGNGTGGPGYTIPAEFRDSLTHVYGAVGAARLADAQNPLKASSGSQFYIVVPKAGYHGLDKNYTVFGIVINGLSAVDAIVLVPSSGSPNYKPITNVYMTKVEAVIYTRAQLKAQFNFTIPNFN